MIRRFVETSLFALYALLLAFSLSLIGMYLWVREDLPQLPDSLEQINLSLPTEIYSANGDVVKILGQRHPVSLEDIHPYFTKAIIAVEDTRFYSHSGVDPVGLLRALYQNIKERRIRQGGSTLTQQLSKNLFFSFERNWVRKIKELLVAVQMEATFSKDEILEAYCNQVYFGSGAYGVEEAAQVYFGRRAKDLTLLQAAMLAGLPNSPNSANPFSNFDRAMRRAETVLKRMKKSNFIGFSEMHEATRSDLALAAPIKISNSNQYFINFVIQRMEKQYGKEFVHFGGLKVFTTLDSRYQSFAYQAAERHLKSLDRIMEKKEAPSKLQVAVVVLENKTGAVRVLLGGRKFSESQFNRAVSNNRLPGSSFKPVVYLSAMENLGLSPASSIVDEPTTFLIPGSQPWEPQNFNGKYYGPVILKKALMSSINVISAKMVYELTPRRVIKTARQLGIVSPLGDNLSLALGTSGVSSLEMAGVYSVIANLGILNEPYFIQKIEDYRGKPIYEHFYYGVQRFSAKTIYPLLDMMRGVVDGGSGRVIRRLGFKHPAGGKTGTSNDFKDGWFNGFTKDYSSSVWVGYDNNNSMIDKNGKGLTGSRAAAPIWAQLMKKVLEGKSPANFPVPQGIRFADVDFRTGFLANSDTSGKLNVAVKEEVVLTLPRPIETDLLGTELEGQSGVTFPRELNGLSEF